MKFTGFHYLSERVSPKLGRKSIADADTKISGRPRLNRDRLEANFPRPYVPYPGIESFENSGPVKQSRGSAAIWENGLPIDFFFDIHKYAPLVVVLNGAAQPEMRLPWFAGDTVSSGMFVSRLSISDPSLYLDPSLNLAWYAGNQYQPFLHKTLARLIRHVARVSEAPKIVLLGGSGGGFASMLIASQLTSSTAIVMNPQTSIERYHPTHRQRYIDIAWAGSDKLFHQSAKADVDSEVEASIGEMTILYMQNRSDTFHVKNHLAPFRESFHSAPGMWLLLEEWREGHTPPPKKVISSTLQAAIRPDSDVYQSLGYSPL